jgi:hypothetical protein
MNIPLKHFLMGIVLGVVVPAAAFYVFYRLHYVHIPFAAYLKMLSARSMLSKILSISAVPNLLCFYLCLWFNRDNLARGVVGGTMVTAICVAVIYFVL